MTGDNKSKGSGFTCPEQQDLEVLQAVDAQRGGKLPAHEADIEGDSKLCQAAGVHGGGQVHLATGQVATAVELPPNHTTGLPVYIANFIQSTSKGRQH